MEIQASRNTLSDLPGGGYLIGEMPPQSDAWLLREYAEHGKESAFAEITARHTNVVYSAALRQVDSPDLAAEVAQQAFIGLARGAQALSRKLAEDASLAGWLCRSARNISLNLRRDEFRRHSRERQAMAQHDPTPETLPDWEQLCPLLDEAMADLSETDYDAIVLRYYQQQDLRSVGRALGLSDDAAQKRVSRAVEQLRESFAKRGLTLGAGGLAAVISANAVQAVPAGLAATITAAALSGTTITTTAVFATTKAIAMTTLQKTVITAVLAATVGTGIYEARQAANARAEVHTLQQQQAEQVEQMQRDADERARQLATLRDENHRLTRDTSDLLRLRRDIGELRSQTKTYEEIRKENAQLRSSLDKAGQAQQTPTNNYPMWWRQKAPLVASILSKSVLSYAAQNHGQLPKNVSEASGLFKDALQPDPVLQDESALAESAKLFQLVFQGSNEGLTNGHNVILIRETVPQQRADGMFERAYGFADGHGEVWVSPDGNYSDKEAKRPTYSDTNTTNRLERIIVR